VKLDVRNRERGFTLTEIAIVFMIVALLIGGTVLTLSAQNETREISDTQRTLEQARDAIMGFALRNGRLPCPAPGGVVAVEQFCTNASGACGLLVPMPPGPVPAHGRCSNPSGFVPGATLGIGPIETNPASPNFGLLLDSWLQPVRYAVTQVDVIPPPNPPSNVMLFTAPGAMKANILASPPVSPDLLVCTTRAGADPVGVAPLFLPACAGPGFQTPAVVYSTGKNFAQQLPVGPAGSADEQANIHFGEASDRIYVSRPPSPAPAPFDDLVIWVSPNILYNRLISAGAI
jgi:type II secretory pathway pseudopilin PulG